MRPFTDPSILYSTGLRGAMMDRPRTDPSAIGLAGSPDVPSGWTYNPASWPERLPIIGVALLGFGIASYLALYQWNVFPTVWEPFSAMGAAESYTRTSRVSCRFRMPRSARSLMYWMR